ncbi:MAG: MFS transporter [Bauldia sp.]|nr:MFS transporter [Bauldia sp.]
MTVTLGYRSLLALPGPRRLALGAIPADLADWLDYAAIVALLVFIWDGGPFTLALFAVALSLPYVLVGPVLLALLHRMPLRTLLVVSNAGRAATTAALVFAGDPAIVLAVVFLRSSIDSVFTPARQAAIKATTPHDLLSPANGLHQAINQTSKIAGPALGGLLLGIVAPAVVFALNAGLSLVAAIVMATVALPHREPEAATETFFRRSLAGLNELRLNRKLRLAVAFIAMAYAAFFLYDALISLLAIGFGFDATAYGLSIAASGLGGVVGALVAGRLSGPAPMTVMAAGAGVSGGITIVVGAASLADLAVPFWLFFLTMGVMGAATAFILVPYRTIIQSTVAHDRVASVFATGEAISVAAMLAAPFIGSTIAVAWGTGAAFIAGGIMLLVLVAWTFAGPAARE